MKKRLETRIREAILKYGFRTAVNYLVQLGYSEQQAIKEVRRILDATPGAKQK